MPHEIDTITNFEIVAPYTLRLTFNDGVIKAIDFLLMLRGELYSPLRDLDFFNQVRLDQEAETIVWSNGADFDPATLHDWDEVGEEMIEMASRWEVEPQKNQTVSLEQVLPMVEELTRQEQIQLLQILGQELDLPLPNWIAQHKAEQVQAAK